MQTAVSPSLAPKLAPFVAASVLLHAAALLLLGAVPGTAPGDLENAHRANTLQLYLQGGRDNQSGPAAGSRLELGERTTRTPAPPSRHAIGAAGQYLPARELDQRPQIRVHVEPEYPALALAPSGRVVLRLYINEAGGVDDIGVESADSTGAFEAAARQAFSAARFYPGMKNGRPVKSLLRIEVLFGQQPPAAGPGQLAPRDGR